MAPWLECKIGQNRPCQQARNLQGGGTYTVKQNINRLYDFKRAAALVDAALALPPVDGPNR